MAKYKICFVTTDNKEVAEKIANELVSQKLAACVNIIPSITSIYRWEGKIEKSKEFMLVIKTKSVLVKDVIIAVKNMHNYSLPETIFFDISDGSSQYLDWLGANTLFTSNISKDREEDK
ncbi:MAG: divalent-cation tolerance protein CutA [Elusimicrobiota bacterium]